MSCKAVSREQLVKEKSLLETAPQFGLGAKHADTSADRCYKASCWQPGGHLGQAPSIVGDSSRVCFAPQFTSPVGAHGRASTEVSAPPCRIGSR